jgi:hypothetical protein
MSISSSHDAPLRWQDLLALSGVALVVGLVLMALQPVPGYMDADYYYAGGLQLASGHGFTDAFLWNYLDQPTGLPHPSNSYWYPLAALLAAAGMGITGRSDFVSARLFFLLMMVLAPVAVSALAWRMTGRRQTALLAGSLAIFAGYYLPFLVTTDNYSPYLLIGACYFLLLDRMTYPRALILGLLAGVLNLARGDGLLWLPITLAAVVLMAYQPTENRSGRSRNWRAVVSGLITFLGYLVVMGGWFARNWMVFGDMLPPGSGHVLWMTNYNQIYSFTPQIYTFRSWMSSGWQAILTSRLAAALQNLATSLFAQGSLFLTPLILIGAWNTWHSARVRVGVFGWLLMFLAESLLFPFASVNGGFFHAGAAFQPLWFVLAPVGLDVVLKRILKNQSNPDQKATFTRLILLVFMVIFSAWLVKIRVFDRGWTEGEYVYQQADRFLVEQGASPAEIVMVRNPPAYFVMTGRPSIVIPYGGVQVLLEAAGKYDARYVILEGNGIIQPLEDLYAHPKNYPEFSVLGSFDDNLILSVQPVR